MAELDVSKLATDMLGAAMKVLNQKWPEAAGYAESEFKKIAESIALIQRQCAAGKMTEEQARLHLELQRIASRNVLLTLEGLGLLTAEAAINAALQVVKVAVNTAIGIVLLL